MRREIALLLHIACSSEHHKALYVCVALVKELCASPLNLFNTGHSLEILVGRTRRPALKAAILTLCILMVDVNACGLSVRGLGAVGTDARLLIQRFSGWLKFCGKCVWDFCWHSPCAGAPAR